MSAVKGAQFLDRLPPHSIQAEQSVLGGLLADNQSWHLVTVTADDFYRRDHRLLFQAMADLLAAEKPCDQITLAEHLDRNGSLKELGGLEYITNLWENVPSAANIESYCLIVRKKSEARRTLEWLEKVRGAIYEGKDTAEIFTEFQPPSEISSAPVISRRLSDVKPEPILWLWPRRIAKGKITVFAGDPGGGKSQIGISMSAITTTGGQWPVDRTRAQRGNVIIVSAEDDAADTIRPRLEAAGADVSRVWILDAVVEDDAERPFLLTRDVARLGDLMRQIGDVALVIIDPISAYLGSTDSHKNADVRAALAPLGKLAAEYNAAVVCVSHLNKSNGGNALSRVTGSLAFVAAARAAYIVARDPDDEKKRLFLPAKNNIGPDSAGLAFHIESASVNGIDTSRISWHADPVTITADDVLMTVDDEKRTEQQEAADWLREILSDGPRRVKEIQAEAKAYGFGDKTLQRARRDIGAIVERESFGGGCRWTLPGSGQDIVDRSRGDTVVQYGEKVETQTRQGFPADDDPHTGHTGQDSGTDQYGPDRKECQPQGTGIVGNDDDGYDRLERQAIQAESGAH